ncbi:MAG: DUF1572 family protein [Vicinamibacterales bacterium]
MPAAREIVATLAREFRKVKALGDAAIAQLDDAHLHARLDAEANSVAMLMRHLAGNMQSRWTDFLTSDGEKPWRRRDEEFEPPAAARADLAAAWEAGWATLFTALDALSDADLPRPVVIRGESQSVLAAITRQLAHYAGHVHQIVLLGKHLRGPAWQVLSIPRGQSQAFTDRLKAGPPPA